MNGINGNHSTSSSHSSTTAGLALSRRHPLAAPSAQSSSAASSASGSSSIVSSEISHDIADASDEVLVETDATRKYAVYGVIPEFEVPAVEIVGDVFDRQRVMKNWDQDLLERQTALVLGVGGVGCSVALALTRMGIGRILLIDRDVVDASNLNRQLLFSTLDVGKRKVDAAMNALRAHNLRTRIEAFHIDAVVQWQKIIELAKQSTVIFNNIDYGAVFDYAINSLSKSLEIPYLSANTYSNNTDLSFFSGLPSESCFSCINHVNESFILTEKEITESRALKPRKANSADSADVSARDIMGIYFEKRSMTGPKFEEIINELMDQLAADDAKTSSAASSSSSSATPSTAADSSSIASKSSVVTADDDWNHSELVPVSPLISRHQLRTDFGRRLLNKIVSLLSPTVLLTHSSLSFIPKDAAIVTRNIGSWICVAAIGSLALVNIWVKYLFHFVSKRIALSSSCRRNLQEKFGPKSASASSTQSAAPQKAEEFKAAKLWNWSTLNLSLQFGGHSSEGFPMQSEAECVVCKDAMNLRAKAEKKSVLMQILDETVKNAEASEHQQPKDGAEAKESIESEATAAQDTKDHSKNV